MKIGVISGPSVVSVKAAGVSVKLTDHKCFSVEGENPGVVAVFGAVFGAVSFLSIQEAVDLILCADG